MFLIPPDVVADGFLHPFVSLESGKMEHFGLLKPLSNIPPTNHYRILNKLNQSKFKAKVIAKILRKGKRIVYNLSVIHFIHFISKNNLTKYYFYLFGIKPISTVSRAGLKLNQRLIDILTKILY